MNPNNLILHSLKEQEQSCEVFWLNTSKYRERYLTDIEANRSSWLKFKKDAKPLYSQSISNDSDLELTIIPKSVTWSDKDISVFVGSDQRSIRYFGDLEPQEGAIILNWHLQVALRLLSTEYPMINVSHGFNPIDDSPGTHSLRNKLHTHIYVIPKDGRLNTSWRKLSCFQRLMLIEPFAQIYYDYIKFRLNKDLFVDLKQVPKLGYLPGINSLYFQTNQIDKYAIQELLQLLNDMENVYLITEGIFTDRDIETNTGFARYQLRPVKERLLRLDAFVTKNQWLTNKSISLLKYMNDAVVEAGPRNKNQPTAILSADQLWVAKGFCGAINFSFQYNKNQIRFDFAPRIISTSGAAKFISHVGKPTLIRKNTKQADCVEISALKDYEKRVVAIAQELSSRYL